MSALQGAFLSTLVGVPFGIAASIVAWFIVFRVIVPKFKFSEQINKIPSVNQGEMPRYRVKLKNVGRRNTIDVDVFARLRVRNLSQRPEFSRTWTIVTLSSDTTHEPRIPSGANRIVVLNLDDTPELSNPKFTAALAGRASTLEVLLSLGEKAELVVWVLAFDEFSGARKAFISKHYQLADLCEGKFGGMDGLEVIPFSSEKKIS
jgi:hypothetical protein